MLEHFILRLIKSDTDIQKRKHEIKAAGFPVKLNVMLQVGLIVLCEWYDDDEVERTKRMERGKG